ncbi:MAG: type VI secretion system baseplate subunit TssG [Pseudomonadota bacterium]
MKRPLEPDEPWRYDLFSLLRWLERERADRPRISDSARRSGDLATLSQNPFMAFPASNVVGARENEAGRAEVTVQFLGLLGPMGALPMSLTEEAYFWQVAEDDAFPRFLDVFNNRFIQLFFRAWANARPITHHDRPNSDRFLDYVGSVVGLGIDAGEHTNGVSTLAKAGYAGILSARVKSASRLRSFLAGLFDVDVAVQEFVPVELPLAAEDQSQLGSKNSGLGVDLMVGSAVLAFDEKVRIRVTVASLEEYQSFLPAGPNSTRLADAIEFYLGEELDWDIELALPTEVAPAAALGSAGQLGWTGWMNPQYEGQTKTVLTDARFRPPTPHQLRRQ